MLGGRYFPTDGIGSDILWITFHNNFPLITTIAYWVTALGRGRVSNGL